MAGTQERSGDVTFQRGLLARLRSADPSIMFGPRVGRSWEDDKVNLNTASQKGLRWKQRRNMKRNLEPAPKELPKRESIAYVFHLACAFQDLLLRVEARSDKGMIVGTVTSEDSGVIVGSPDSAPMGMPLH